MTVKKQKTDIPVPSADWRERPPSEDIECSPPKWHDVDQNRRFIKQTEGNAVMTQQSDLSWVFDYAKNGFNVQFSIRALLLSNGISIGTDSCALTEAAFDDLTEEDGMVKTMWAVGIKALNMLRGDYILINSDDKVIGYVEFHSRDCTQTCTFYGNMLALSPAVEAIEKAYPYQWRPTGTRLSNGPSGSIIQTETNLSEVSVPSDYSVVYPECDMTPAELWAAFEKSNSKILFIYGPPGTGKSSFISTILKVRGDKPLYLADDANVLTNPALIDTIRSMPSGSLLVTEDSDMMVKARSEYNTSMSGILNAISGIAAVDVRYIISTNLPTLKDVDDALIRPGRMFRKLHFPKISGANVNAVREAFGKPPIDNNGTDLTLAEILNHGDSEIDLVAPVMGFQVPR